MTVTQAITSPDIGTLYIQRPEWTFSREWWRRTEGGWVVGSSILVCPYCCEAWATLTIPSYPRHRVTTCLCRTCDQAQEDELFIPGSLLSNLWLPENTDWELFDLFPLDLKLREARLALEYMCKRYDLALVTGSVVSQTDSTMCSTADSTSALPSAISASPPSSSPQP